MTKAEEMKVLGKIVDLVNSTGPDGYVKAAFDEFVINTARQNIECDFMQSGSRIEDLQRWQSNVKKAQEERENLEAAIRLQGEDMKRALENLESQRQFNNELQAMNERQAETIRNQAQEIIELKAKLYDLITK